MTTDSGTSGASLSDTAAESDARRWALGTLGLDKTTEPVDAAAVLQIVTESSYVLPLESVDAVATMLNPSLAPRWAAELGRERRLTNAVSGFARTFFDLTEWQQDGGWNSLCHDCREVPSLARWLDDLKPGLGVIELPSSPNERMNELVKLCCEAFVSKRPGRIRRIQELKQKCLDDEETWGIAASELQTLSPQFVEKITPWILKDSGNATFWKSPSSTIQTERSQQLLRAEFNGTTSLTTEGWLGILVMVIGVSSVTIIVYILRTSVFYQ